MGNLFKDIAIGMGHAVGTAVPQMEASDRADVELGMRKETHDAGMQKVQKQQRVEKRIADIFIEHKNMLASSSGQAPGATPAAPAFDEQGFQKWYGGIAAQRGLNPNPDDPLQKYDYRAAYTAGAQPDASGHWPSEYKMEGHPNMIVDGVNTKTGQPAAQPEQVWGDAGVTVRGASNVDTGTGIEIGQKANPAPQGVGAIGPAKQSQQEQTPQILNVRGNMLAKMHDVYLSEGMINEAKLIKKAEMDNILQILKAAPKAGLQAWNNSPWLVEQFGPLDASSLTKEGEWAFLKFGEDGLIRWNKDGRYEVVQKPTGTAKSVNKQHKGSTPDGRTVSFNPGTGGLETDDGKPYSGKVIPSVERVVHEGKPEKITMSDARSYASAKLQGIKNRMMVDMAPEERTDFANIPPENLMAALLGGGRSLPADKKEAYKKEIEAVEKEYEGMAEEVLGRKGKKPQQGVVGGKRTMGDLYSIIKKAGSSSKAVAALGKLGYNENQAKKIIKDGIAGGYVN